jgi:hypothetical protein
MKTTFPKDPARALRKADILIELDGISDQTIFGYTIRHALSKEGPKDGLLEMIRMQAATSYWAVADIIGYKLLDKIIAFK